tara:strand:+ start:460 stop:600 length:141 start_codon:yes stop_codon:yes gene_type:complete
MKIIPCTNGVGEWEIDETHETFDTYEEALDGLCLLFVRNLIEGLNK